MKKLNLWGKHKGNRSAQSMRYRKKYPYKNKVYQKVYLAKKRKEITRPKKCSLCEKYKFTLAHHHSYEKPFELLWVCYDCHNIIHKNFKQKAR